MAELWERQKGESGKSYSWFVVYRDLGPLRTFDKVISKIEEMIENDKKGQDIIELPTYAQLGNQSYRWHWVKRCRRYDNHLDELRRKKREQDYLKLEYRLIKVGEKIIDRVEENVDDLSIDVDSKPTSISHALKSTADAYDKGVKDLRLLYGRSTENKESKLEGSVDIEADSKVSTENQILEKAQAVFMQPAYVELTKKVMDDAAEEIRNRNKE